MIPTIDYPFEIRCPVHGFVTLNEWEREIINLKPFQRLRRIRQLGWTEHVYPGATHTRFEHSLGVMHVATLLFDSVWKNSADLLRDAFKYKDSGRLRSRQLVRLAALFHDVGHGPFSHAAEDLLPESSPGSRYSHEDYSAAVVRKHFKDVIENHPTNSSNYDFRADKIAALLEGSQEAKNDLFWRDLISGQMDADRMDYLLRDSCHAGVQYGRFDLERLASTVCAVPGDGGRAPRLGVQEGGLHGAEALALARRFMFLQVYFHKTRLAYDIHLRDCLGTLLPNGQFPEPVGEGLDRYLEWDDWKVLGLLSAGKGGEHGRRLAERDHYREVYHTPEVANQEEIEKLKQVRETLGSMVAAEEFAEKSWYKTGGSDIPVLLSVGNQRAAMLSDYSPVVKNLATTNQVKLFAEPHHAGEARKIVDRMLEDS